MGRFGGQLEASRLESGHLVLALIWPHNSPDPGTSLEIRSLIKNSCRRQLVRSEQHFRRLIALIRAYLDALDVGRFVYRPGKECSMCD